MTCLSLVLLAFLHAGPEKAASNSDAMAAASFKERADDLLSSIGMQFMASGIVLGPEALGFYKECREFKNFHGELPQALRSDDSETRKAALKYLMLYASMVRRSCWELDRDERNDAVRRSLGRHALSIHVSLKRLLKKVKGEDALHAAVGLLALCPNNKDALNVLLMEMKSREPIRRQKACEAAGNVRLSQPGVVSALAAALVAKEQTVRQAAAEAVWKIGPRAGKAVPELIALLQSGKDAWGSVHPAMAIPFFQRQNLALLALAEMGDDARPAVPVMARLLKGADEEMQLALLACLGQLGAVAKEAGPAVHQCLDAGAPRTRLRAAVVLLCMNPHDEKAAVAVAAALMSGKKETRAQGLEECAGLGPKVKALVPLLVAILNNNNRDGNFEMAAEAVGKMGPIAAAAVPLLARMLGREGEPDWHGDTIPHAAAQALAGIGKPGLPALVRVLHDGRPHPRTEGNKDESELSALDRLIPPGTMGRMYAAHVLGEFRNNKAEVVPVLMKALNEDLIQGEAAYALGRLRPDDTRVKDALIRIRDRKEEDLKDNPKRKLLDLSAETRMMAAWALTQLPQ